MNKSDFKVGQKVFIAYFDSRSRGSNRFIKIVKIGNKWISLENGDRFNSVDMLIDGGVYASAGRVYITEELYEERCKKQKLYSYLKTKLSCSYDEEITSSDIEKVLELLKIPMEDK